MNYTVSKNPATGQVNAEIPNSDLSRIPEIVNRARIAQTIWGNKSFDERAKYIKRIRNHIRDHAEEIAQTVANETGKTLIEAMLTEVLPVVSACNWYMSNTKKYLKPETLPLGSILFAQKKNQVIHVPLGVVGIFTPWNYPFNLPGVEVIMGLMAGNAIILKVATQTPGVGIHLENAVKSANLPDGLFTHLIGPGEAISTALLNNGINKIFFTGSTVAGKHLMEQAAKTLTPLSLELGGNDAMIVCADADLERASNGAAWGAFTNCGQTCAGIARIYVEESVYDAFVELLSAKTAAIRHGVDKNFDVDMGSLTTAKQLATVQAHLQDALDKGAKIVAQSQPSGDVSQGYFHPATVLTNTNHDMLTVKEETFGPLVSVMPFKTIDEAIEMANDSKYALSGSVWTKDNAKGRKIAERIVAGAVCVNNHLYTNGVAETPWGGPKDSGLGRTHGKYGLLEMTQPRVINWDLLPGPREQWWYPYDKTTYHQIHDMIRFISPQSFSDIIQGVKSIVAITVNKALKPWKV